VVRTSIDNLDVGDWIEVGGHAGEIKENGLLTTTLYAIDLANGVYRHTGRRISFPNSVFLSEPVQQVPKLTFILHSFQITLATLERIDEQSSAAKTALQDLTEPFAKEASDEAAKAKKRLDSDFTDGGSTVELATNDTGQPRLKVRVFCPVEKAGEIEQAMIIKVLTPAKGP